MIGMIAYAILGGFILIAVMIGNRLVKIFGWSLSLNKLFFLRAGVFFGMFFVLFFDRIIGMIQFEYICYRKATVKLDPDWIKVRRAKFEIKEINPKGYLVPTSYADHNYQDMDTGKIFLSFTQCNQDESRKKSINKFIGIIASGILFIGMLGAYRGLKTGAVAQDVDSAKIGRASCRERV